MNQPFHASLHMKGDAEVCFVHFPTSSLVMKLLHIMLQIFLDVYSQMYHIVLLGRYQRHVSQLYIMADSPLNLLNLSLVFSEHFMDQTVFS